jgi:hypothetical protein
MSTYQSTKRVMDNIFAQLASINKSIGPLSDKTLSLEEGASNIESRLMDIECSVAQVNTVVGNVNSEVGKLIQLVERVLSNQESEENSERC